MKRKLLSVTLLVVLTMSIFAGCGKKTNVEKKPYEPTVTDLDEIKVGPYDWPVNQAIDYTKSYNKRWDGLEFTCVIGGTGTDLPEGQTVEENIFTWALEGTTGLKAKVLWNAGGAAYTQKKSNAISNGEIPDLMGVDLQQYRALVKAGLIADLTDELLEGDHPTLQKIYASRDNVALDALKIDGRIYGIPTVAAGYDASPLIWIRKDWMEKLNLEEPKSLKDLEEIALAFMNQDPDGNGLKDTYGLPCTATYGMGGEGSLLNIMLNVGDGVGTGFYLEEEDGTLVAGGTQEGAKEALIFLNRWYEMGIIPEDFATWDISEVQRVVGNNQAGITLAPWFGAVLGINSSISLNDGAEWVSYLLPEEEGGQVYAYEGDPINTIYVVRKDFEYPEAFVYAYDMYESFGNEFNTEAPDPNFSYTQCEGYVTAPTTYQVMASALPYNFYYGPIDEVTEHTESAGGVTALNNVEAISGAVLDKVTDPLMKKRISSYTLPALEVLLADSAGKNPREVVISSLGKDATALSSYQHYLLYWVGPKAIADADPIGVSTKYMGTTKSMSMYLSFLSKTASEEYTMMIMGRTGGKSISEYFDEYVKTYNKQGGTVIMEEINEDYKKNYK